VTEKMLSVTNQRRFLIKNADNLPTRPSQDNMENMNHSMHVTPPQIAH